MSHIETHQNGHILEIKVNRPEKHNALSPEMYRDLARAYGELSRNPELRVGLLYGEGAHFSSGVELDKWAPIFGNGKGFEVGEGEIDPFGLQAQRHTKPVVMAVQGNCFTWGVEIMLNTEIRVAASDTRFAMLEVKRGIFPCGGATLRLPRQMGWGAAHRYLLTGEFWYAEEALRTGLVQEVWRPASNSPRPAKSPRRSPRPRRWVCRACSSRPAWRGTRARPKPPAICLWTWCP